LLILKLNINKSWKNKKLNIKNKWNIVKVYTMHKNNFLNIGIENIDFGRLLHRYRKRFLKINGNLFGIKSD